ncbi:MAG: PEGA domain-containing protein [Lentisphaerae bacterium]|nr:PEGA domain-containing protein [Lentisphaerota bacterium]
MNLSKVIWLAWVLAAGAAAPPEPATCQVRISTVPPDALISCDRVVREASPVLLTDLAPGPHLLIATKNGYRETRQTVILKPGQRIAVEMNLEPLRGLLVIHSEPSGATVRIDGADRGSTPLLITDLPLGARRVNLSLQGYVPKDVDITLGDRTPARVFAELASDSAKLQVDSDPPGAEVSLNGIRLGRTTPCVIDRIPAGESTLALALPGYKPYSQTMKLAPGSFEKLSALLDPMPAKLTVVTIPEAARVYVENQFRGESPVTLEDLTPGDYRVRADKPGYDPLARTIALERGQTTVEEFRLQSNAGGMRLTTEPAGVSVFIDGEARGVTAVGPGVADTVSDPLLISLLPVGEHTLLLSKKGYYDRETPLRISAGETVSLHERLRRRFIPDCEVTTTKAVYRGMLVEVDPQGNVRLETRPGVIMTIPAADVRVRRPLRSDAEQPPTE